MSANAGDAARSSAGQPPADEGAELITLFADKMRGFPWKERVYKQIEERRVKLSDRLIFDILLAGGGISHPNSIYPPADNDGLQKLLEEIENTSYDILKRDCLIYYLLKWNRDGREAKWKFERAIPQHFVALADAYWHLDSGIDVGKAVSWLSDPRLVKEHTSKILQAISLADKPYPLIRRYVRVTKPTLTEPDDMDTYVVALADSSINDAWTFLRKFSETSSTRDRLLRKVLEFCLTPKPRPQHLKQLLAHPLSSHEVQRLHAYALHPPANLSTPSVAALHDLVCLRLLHSGAHKEAVKLDRRLAARAELNPRDRGARAALDRRQIMDDIIAALPLAERQLLELELEELAKGNDPDEEPGMDNSVEIIASFTKARPPQPTQPAPNPVPVANGAANGHGDISMSWESVAVPSPASSTPASLSASARHGVAISPETPRISAPEFGRPSAANASMDEMFPPLDFTPSPARSNVSAPAPAPTPMSTSLSAFSSGTPSSPSGPSTAAPRTPSSAVASSPFTSTPVPSARSAAQPSTPPSTSVPLPAFSPSPLAPRAPIPGPSLSAFSALGPHAYADATPAFRELGHPTSISAGRTSPLPPLFPPSVSAGPSPVAFHLTAAHRTPSSQTSVGVTPERSANMVPNAFYKPPQTAGVKRQRGEDEPKEGSRSPSAKADDSDKESEKDEDEEMVNKMMENAEAAEEEEQLVPQVQDDTQMLTDEEREPNAGASEEPAEDEPPAKRRAIEKNIDEEEQKQNGDVTITAEVQDEDEKEEGNKGENKRVEQVEQPVQNGHTSPSHSDEMHIDANGVSAGFSVSVFSDTPAVQPTSNGSPHRSSKPPSHTRDTRELPGTFRLSSDEESEPTPLPSPSLAPASTAYTEQSGSAPSRRSSSPSAESTHSSRPRKRTSLPGGLIDDEEDEQDDIVPPLPPPVTPARRASQRSRTVRGSNQSDKEGETISLRRSSRRSVRSESSPEREPPTPQPTKRTTKARAPRKTTATASTATKSKRKRKEA